MLASFIVVVEPFMIQDAACTGKLVHGTAIAVKNIDDAVALAYERMVLKWII
jgi:hypothetical protein